MAKKSTLRPKGTFPIAIAIVGVFLAVIGIAFVIISSAAVNTTTTSTASKAWDCSRYNLRIDQSGSVYVVNGSTYSEPQTFVEAYINDVQVVPTEVLASSPDPKMLWAPALAPNTPEMRIGKVPVPTNGVFTWRAIAVADRNCDDRGGYGSTPTPTIKPTTTPTPTPQAACSIGIVFAQKQISDQPLNNRVGYIPTSLVRSTRPDIQTVEIDLYRRQINGKAATITAQELRKHDGLIVVDMGMVPNTSDVPVNERPRATDITAIVEANTTGVDVVLAGDNGRISYTNPAGRGQDAASLVRPVSNALQSEFVYLDQFALFAERVKTVSTMAYGPSVPMFVGTTTDTTGGGLHTPGMLQRAGTRQDVTCVDAVSGNGVKFDTCLLAYLPKTGSKGMIVIDTNKGRPTKAKLAQVLSSMCAR